LERDGGLVAREALERPRDYVALAGERTLDGLELVADLEAQTEGTQFLDELRVRLVGEPFGDCLRALRADSLHLEDVLLARAHQPVNRLEVASEVLCGHPADVRDVQAEEYAVERNLLRGLDRRDRISSRDLPVALELHQLLLRQSVQLGQRADEPEIPEPSHRLFAHAFDVRGGLDPVDQRLEAA